jgi:hypothetical protein
VRRAFSTTYYRCWYFVLLGLFAVVVATSSFQAGSRFNVYPRLDDAGGW